MIDTQLCEKILEYVSNLKCVSFAELDRSLKQHFNIAGERTLLGADNLVLWTDMSQDYVDSILHLKDKGQLELRGTTYLIYLMDGGGLELPLAKRIRAYKKPHWLPTVMDVPR